MKTGDTVRDSITGETWTLAYYDAERDEAAWCGWPEGMVQRASERLTLVEACTPAEELKLLREIAAIAESDHRQRRAQRILRERGLES